MPPRKRIISAQPTQAGPSKLKRVPVAML